MDYCHPCRRHLNGALACAGCGTPAEELRHESPHAYVPAVETGHVYELDPVEPPQGSAQGGGRAARRRAAAGSAVTERAVARRDRRSRGRRGRTVLAGALGVMLAAGALGLAKTLAEEPAEGGAATAVREEDVVESSLPPEPSRDPGETEGSRPVREPAPATSPGTRAPASGPPGAGAPGTGGGTRDSATGTAGSGGPEPSASGSPSGPADGPEASPSATVSRHPATTVPGDQPSTGTPSPTPSPTEKPCTPFLWWCV
ncbi:hypothetical protein [Streptomyces sp. NPDC048577]|uniref:SCO2400 family protein n=1 Tax=Streptomyces sp. NPDC048577 TaxID=3157209 RepID=UPI003446A4EC